ncbi:hypothetical protein [Tardiphaga sp.]|uniref:hypothetical protein n=1 Tax=Tardiphaga sp. TaxID=1926292 RepID=UPI002618E67D|nr:hypothetical protein [Tardiphaga sp.]MDB5615928.1 hypothetical protein [Tardiphaga sp.]
MSQFNVVAVARKLSVTTAAVWATIHSAARAGTLDALFMEWGFYAAPAPQKVRTPRAPRSRTMTAATMDRMVRQFYSTGSVSLAA